MTYKVSESPSRRYLLNDFRAPLRKDIDLDISWVCASLGLMESKDTEKTAVKVFKIILRAVKAPLGLTSDEIAEQVGLTRAGAIHHLNKMTLAGLVVKRGAKYELRQLSMEKTVEEVQRDVQRVFQNMKQIARDIDESMGIPRR